MEVKDPKKAARIPLAELVGVAESAYNIEADEESNSITVTFQKNQLHVSEVIEQMMKQTEVKDIKIQETELADIVKAIYNHGV